MLAGADGCLGHDDSPLPSVDEEEPSTHSSFSMHSSANEAAASRVGHLCRQGIHLYEYPWQNRFVHYDANWQTC